MSNECIIEKLHGFEDHLNRMFVEMILGAALDIGIEDEDINGAPPLIETEEREEVHQSLVYVDQGAYTSSTFVVANTNDH